MKKTIFLFVFAVIGLSLQAFAGGYEIKVNVKGLSDSTCQLAYYFGDKQYIKDSAKADAKGNLIFKGQEDLPGGIYMVVLPGKKYFEMIVDKEQRFSLESDAADLVVNMKVKGSKDNEIFYDYLRWISIRGKQAEELKKELDANKSNPSKSKEIKDKQTAIDAEVKQYKNDIIAKHPAMLLSAIFKASTEPDVPEPPKNADGSIDSLFRYRYFRAHYFDNINMKDDRLLRTPVFAPKIKQYVERIIPQHPDSICAGAKKMIDLTDEKSDIFKYLVFYITNTYEKSNIMGMDAVFVCMAEQYYLSGKAFWVDSAQTEKIRERVNALKPCLIGKQAYNMRMYKPDFQQISLNEVKNRYTIIYFWDPSCGHCQKVTPKLSEFYKTNKEKFDVEVFGVYIETDTTEWFKYIKEKELTWLNVADLTLKTNFRAYYDIYSTPVIYVLDRNKKIIAKRIDVENLADFLTNYSKQNP
ncbi:MAG: thioredoxin-like domain-containing protein [Bacteroidia bacterium]|jgi:thiol-disulfide isomerase/thioredoxin